MKQLRSRLTYANVVSTIALFLVLGGATAFAAKQLAKNSVGTKQLKKNAVTAVKIKLGAVTGAKLSAGSVDGTKLADGAVTGGKLANGAVTGAKIGKSTIGADNLDPSIAIPHVTQRLVATQQVQFVPNLAIDYPFDNPTLTQPAGEDELLVGAITVRFDQTCKTPRSFTAELKTSGPDAPNTMNEIATATGFDETGAAQEVTADFGDPLNGTGPIGLLGLDAPRQHNFLIKLFRVNCGAGSPATAAGTATHAELDAIGFR